MSKVTVFLCMLFASALLAACADSLVDTGPQPVPDTVESVVEAKLEQVNSASDRESGSVVWPDGQTQEDNQGEVSIAVKPVNLNNDNTTLDFEVAMNTHSVDLSMDLVQLATLSTDSGLSVQAISWQAPQGGHHVTGLLHFPALIDGAPVLEAATQVTLIINDVSVPQRTFIWQLSQ